MRNPNRLTAEQRKFIADMMAELMAENAKTDPTIRKTLAMPNTETLQYNFRIPLEFANKLNAIAAEVNSSRSWVGYYMLMFAVTGETSPEFEIIKQTAAYQDAKHNN